jgi:predicted nucleotidyltransferase
LSEAFKRVVKRSLKLSAMRSSYQSLLQRFKAELEELLQTRVRILVFGSVVEGKSGPLSDVDVMVISNEFNDVEKRLKTYELARNIFGTPNPFELHLITQEEFEWYKKFISIYREIK